MSAEVMSGGGGSPKLQTKTVSPSTSSQNITPDSNYDGLSKVTINAMPTGSLNEISINSNGLITSSVGTSGYLSGGTNKTLQLSTQGSKTITPGRYSQTAINNGTYATGTVTVDGDTNLRSSNIADGITIFGYTGSYTGLGAQYYTTTVSLSATQNTGWVDGSFKPYYAVFFLNGSRFRGDDTCNSDDNTIILSLWLERNGSSTNRAFEIVFDPRNGFAYTWSNIYESSSEVSRNYSISWDNTGVNVKSQYDYILFDGDYQVVLIG